MLLTVLPWHLPQDPQSPIHALLVGLANRHADPKIRHAAQLIKEETREATKEEEPKKEETKAESLGLGEIKRVLEEVRLGSGPNQDYLLLRRMEADPAALREHAAQLPAYLDSPDSSIRLVTWRILLRLLGVEIEGELLDKLKAEIENAPDPFHALHLYQHLPGELRLLVRLPECLSLPVEEYLYN